ncbi:MAG: glyoxylate/hydroxypyruvate reductase A, partial [Alphaproteobacteria bacterium]|nr:glyoxylate/hydroxypyruvate reductase A [Alphaproteobacteria bacterium]
AFLFILPTWPIDVWTAAMNKVAPDLDVRTWPDALGNVSDIDYAAAWLPPANVLKGLPNLKVIFSLGAGVDAILKDPTLPADRPIVRVNDPDLTGRMTEYVVLHVLMHHRQQRRIDDNQKKRIWNSFPTHAAKGLSVGIMGMGVMGRDSAEKLRDLGFRVAGWSRTRKAIPGVESFAGDAEFDAFLARTDVLVSLLPATPD